MSSRLRCRSRATIASSSTTSTDSGRCRPFSPTSLICMMRPPTAELECEAGPHVALDLELGVELASQRGDQVEAERARTDYVDVIGQADAVVADAHEEAIAL